VIETTLSALMQQRYPGSARIVLVDDRSTDGTAEIADRLAAQGSFSLTVIKGDDTPPGWSGKLWALEQGITHVKEQTPPNPPEFLLLTDADIEHGPDSLVSLVAFALDRRLDMVSLMARLRAANRWERLIVPAFVYFFSQLYPFRRVNRPGSRTAAAAGGCVLIRSQALERAGGLSAIRGAVIDDVTLAGAVKRQGSPIWLGLADDVTSIRSYDQLADLWNMVARSAFTQLRYSITLLLLTVLGLGLVYLAPPFCLLVGLATANPLLGVLGAAGWAVMTLTFVPMQVYYGQRRLAALLLPVTAAMYLGMTVDSALRHWRGAGVTWKGRRYSATGA
jgi:hopene-associated glycosyltransferase HpnB